MRPPVLRRGALLCLLLTVLTPAAARAFCPSYTRSSAHNTAHCDVDAAPGTNPTVAEWQSIFALAAQGPAGWGSAGPAVPDIGQGCGKPEVQHPVPPRFPCEVLKAIAMQESSWRQFCVPDSPADQVGGASRTIISFDCGYGIGQVTSGMRAGETPAFDRARVAQDATYNLAASTQILAAKWKATKCVGDNQPAVVEHWYSAVWAYNGLAYKNNPNNPVYDSSRGVWNPKLGGAAPYQEKVFGWMEHPPTPGHWPALAVAYPELAALGGSTAPPALDDPSCATPTDCTTSRPVHRSGCFPVAPDGGSSDGGLDGGAPDGDAGAPTNDAGAPTNDAGAPTNDAGSGRAPSSVSLAEEQLGSTPEGCGCGAAASSGGGLWAALVLALWRRARRRPIGR